MVVCNEKLDRWGEILYNFLRFRLLFEIIVLSLLQAIRR